jgi:hypothetical protein
MKTIPNRTEPIAAEEIAQLTESGNEISHFFTGSGHMMLPIHTLAEGETYSNPRTLRKPHPASYNSSR